MANTLHFSLDHSSEAARSHEHLIDTGAVHQQTAGSPSGIKDVVTLSAKAVSSSSPASLILFAGAKMDTSSDDVQLLEERGYSVSQIAVELGLPLATVEYFLGIPAIDIAA